MVCFRIKITFIKGWKSKTNKLNTITNKVMVNSDEVLFVVPRSFVDYKAFATQGDYFIQEN